uniref:Ankyrin-like n=1 Tax=Heterorhabditis bacteriophora TaxID=37862 RepID=A0A1I7X7S1_HETBA
MIVRLLDCNNHYEQISTVFIIPIILHLNHSLTNDEIIILLKNSLIARNSQKYIVNARLIYPCYLPLFSAV